MATLGNNNTVENLSSKPGTLIAVRVIDIILNIKHPRAEEFGGYDAIGTIFFGDVYEPNQADNTRLLNNARPYFSFIKQYPLKNEIVLLMNAPTRAFNDPAARSSNHKYYLPNVNIWNHQHNNALPDVSYHIKGEESPNYGMVEGIVTRIAEGDNSVEIPLGEYFKENLSLQPLLPFEGDTIIEGRFGNSIRFGATAKEAPDKTAYSTKGNTGDPITIIRNGQYVEEKDNGWEHTIENINSDHSTIYLTSNQVLPNMEIVSTHWQSWMAKHDELEVDQKDEFDNITEGFEVEAIEPEKPEEGADDELEEATEEDIAAEEEKNEDPEDCEFWPDKEDNDNTGGEGSEQGYPLEDLTNPHPKSPYSPVYDEGSDNELTTSDESSTSPDPVEEAQPAIEPLPPDIPHKVEDWVQYYDPLPSSEGGMGMEILFWIERGYSRKDGVERKNFWLKDEGPYPAGSMREYVFENDPTGMGDWGSVDIKDQLKEYIEAYRNGDRL